MFELITDFPYIGTRKYLHSSTFNIFLFNFFYEKFGISHQELVINSDFSKVIINNGELIITENKILDEYDARFKIFFKTKSFISYFIQDKTKIVTSSESEHYSCNKINYSTNFSGFGCIDGSTVTSYVKNVIQLNKLVNLKTVNNIFQNCEILNISMSNFFVPNFSKNIKVDIKNINNRKHGAAITTCNKIIIGEKESLLYFMIREK